MRDLAINLDTGLNAEPAVDLTIVGAGPAGMAAAVSAADAGLQVLVIDEQARAGGQIFRRQPQQFGAKPGNYAPYTWAGELIERFETHPRIEAKFRSTVFGVLRDRADEGDILRDIPGGMQLQVAVRGPEGGELCETRHLLLATGAYDMPVAFPGWAKPGVMMAGAVQSLLKSQRVLAGRNLVLAGSHPLLLVVAEQMLAAGAHISEIAFARGLPTIGELAEALPAAPGHLGVFAEAAKAIAAIARHRVKVSTRTIVTEAIGGDTVSGVSLAKVDSQWQVIGEPRQIAADLLVLGYGFTPSTELARQAGCEMQWDSEKGGWLVAHDDSFRTTAERVWVAGEPTGVAGAEQSEAEGRIAGLRIAEAVLRERSSSKPVNLTIEQPGTTRKPGTLEPSRTPNIALNAELARVCSELEQAEKHLRRAGSFSRVVQRMFAPERQALADLSRIDGTHVCRCELVTTECIEDVLEKNPFISSANALKLECRSGMGPCQGRYCEGTVAARVAAARGTSVEEAGYFTAHLPVKPVPIDTYRGLAGTPVVPNEQQQRQPE